MNIANQSAREGFPARIFFLLMNIVNQSAREGFPARIFFQISRTEALLCTHSKACNRRPVWRSASLTTNLTRNLTLCLNFYQNKKGFDAHIIFLSSCFESLQVVHTALPVPSEIALAISVQSHNCSSSSIMQLSSPDMLTWQF